MSIINPRSAIIIASYFFVIFHIMTNFDIGCAINNASSWICGSTVIKKIMENPIFTGLLITVLVMVVILGQYYELIKDEGSTKIAKSMIYVFLLITAVMFVHNYAFKNNIETSSHQAGVRDMFSSIQQTRDMSNPDFIPVMPMVVPSQPQMLQQPEQRMQYMQPLQLQPMQTQQTQYQPQYSQPQLQPQSQLYTQPQLQQQLQQLQQQQQQSQQQEFDSSAQYNEDDANLN
jgi:hypothetical protein